MPFLYRIYHPLFPDINHYLLGTMHVPYDQICDIDENVLKKILNDVKIFIAESDLNTLQNNAIFSNYWVRDEFSLVKIINPQKYNRIRKSLIKSFSIDIKHYDNFHPFFIVSLLTAYVLFKGTTKDIMDTHIEKLSKVNNVDVDYLESPAQQIDILHQIPLDVQLRQLYKISRSPSNFVRHSRRMMNLYNLGDEKRLFRSSKKHLGGLRHILLYERNLLMVEKMISSFVIGPTFVTVGAAHLFGGKGILRALKHADYIIKRI